MASEPIDYASVTPPRPADSATSVPASEDSPEAVGSCVLGTVGVAVTLAGGLMVLRGSESHLVYFAMLAAAVLTLLFGLPLAIVSLARGRGRKRYAVVGLVAAGVLMAIYLVPLVGLILVVD